VPPIFLFFIILFLTAAALACNKSRNLIGWSVFFTDWWKSNYHFCGKKNNLSYQ